MNATHALIGDWLGFQAPPMDRDLLRIVEGRLSVSIIKRLSVLGLERFEIDDVVIPSGTLQRRRIPADTTSL